MNQIVIINRILRERSRQDKLHTWDASTNRMAVLAEELGEIAAAMQGQGDLQEELVLLAAVCVRWLEEQNEQSILQKQSMADAAYLQPEQAKMQRDLWRDNERIRKPIIDDHETEEFDLRIAYATEYNHAVKLTVWDDGFTHDITGHVHYVEPITHELRIEVKTGEFERVAFDSVVGVKVLN